MGNTRRRGIQQFIALWLGAVLLSFGLMGGGLLYAVPRLAAKTQGVYEGTRALDKSHRFKLALVPQGRDDSLWHLSRDARYQSDKALRLLQHKEMRLSNEERFEWLGRIQKQTFKLEAMIDDLTDGVQAQTGQLAFEMAEFDLSTLAREVAGEYAAATQTHLVRPDIAASCPVSGDRKRLERVLMNLISNAIKYSPGGSEVNVSLHPDGAHALLRVRDEGAGIAPEDLPRLFLSFSRLESTRKMASGTGLGLSSARKIVEGHGGEVRVHSEPGQGTTFEVSLPLLRPGDAPLPEKPLTLLPASSQTRLAP